MVWLSKPRIDEISFGLGDRSPIFVEFSLLEHAKLLLEAGLLEIVERKKRVGPGNRGVPRVTIPEGAREMLDEEWSKQGIHGFCHVMRVTKPFPAPSSAPMPVRHRIVRVRGKRRVVQVKGWGEAFHAVRLKEADPCLVLNVIGRTRGNLLIARRPLRRDAFPGDLVLATADPRFLERIWKKLPPHLPRWEEVYRPGEKRGKER